jgi:hypothetical protein
MIETAETRQVRMRMQVKRFAAESGGSSPCQRPLDPDTISLSLDLT